MAQEIIMNDEVIEAAEEIATAETGKGLKIAGGVALATLVGFIAYKAGKKLVAMIKAKKAQQAMEQVLDAEADDECASDEA